MELEEMVWVPRTLLNEVLETAYTNSTLVQQVFIGYEHERKRKRCENERLSINNLCAYLDRDLDKD